MKKYLFILTSIVLCFFSDFGYSQLKRVTIDECTSIAVQNHPEIKASDEDNNISVANYGVAKSRSSPLIDFELRTTQPPLVDANGNVVKAGDILIGLFVGPTLTYSLYDPQQTDTINAAKLSIDLTKTKAFKTKGEIVLNAKRSFYEYLFAMEDRAKREELVKKYESKLREARKLVKSSQRPILDLTKSDVDLAEARLEYEKSKNYENIVKSQLLASMGITDEEIEFSPVKIEKLPELRFTLNKLYQLAESNNPDMKIAHINKEINQINVSIARAAHYPSVTFYGGAGLTDGSAIALKNPITNYEDYRNRWEWKNWQWSAFFSLAARVNLWSGGAINSRTDSKIAEYNKSKYIEREILINTRTLIKNYFQVITEYKKQAELTELVIANSQKHLDLAQRSYDNGISTQLELQDAELSLLKSQLSRIRVGYEYLITIARLSNVVGLGEEYLCIK